RAVRLPVALLEDPAAWFAHPAALGGATGFSPARVASLLDAAKPLLGIAGAAGEWELAPGVRVLAQAQGADLRLTANVDTSGFAPPAVSARLVASIGAGLLVRAAGAPLPSLSLVAGIPGAAPGRRALHVALNGDLRVFLRPETGADLSLYPDPPGLGQLAQVAVTQALPLVLDELAAQTGSDLAGDIGRVVREVGDALALRSGAPAHFDGAALQAWATDPATALAARLPHLTTAALNALATALDSALPASVTAAVVGNEIQVTVGGVTVGLATAPFRSDALALRSGAPAHFDGAALQAWATDPATALAARLPHLTTAALNALATALDSALPASVTAAVVGNEIQVTVGGVTVGLATAPF